jgi:hypothetical protein
MGDLVSLFGSLAQTLLCQFLEFSNLPMMPHDSTSSSVATTYQAPSCGSSRALESERYSTGCSGNKQPENMTESRNHVCKRSGDPKTCFVDFRVETFNFADLAPTVQSRRVRDKRVLQIPPCSVALMMSHLQTCLARGLSFGVSAIFSDGYNFNIYVYMYLWFAFILYSCFKQRNFCSVVISV